jgi:lipid II:glycine glycyltransferase (peptidoglycan interpeptide bridge formation enzyme)
VSKFVRINTSPFLPTKTIHVDLKRSEKEIFSSFSEAKRRAVRRATTLGVTVSESNNISDLLRAKNASAGMFGFMTTTGIRELWETFKPDHTSIVLAHDINKKLIGGVLLIHHDQRTYYWIAGSIQYGKKLFAPTLLVWESIKVAKKHKSSIFDFVGTWDERIPTENMQWKGFTKFKEGFGGTQVYYPLVPRT